MMFVLSLSIYLLQPIPVLNHKGASLTTTTRRRHSLQPQGGLTHYSHKGASLTTTTRGCHSLQPQGGITHYNQKGASLTTAARGPHSLQPQGGITHYNYKGVSPVPTTTARGCHSRRLRSAAGICCTSSTLGPGRRLSTSVMLRQPGRARYCASRTDSGA